MRIFLTSEASQALKDIMAKVRTVNEFTGKSFSALASQIVIHECNTLDASRIAQIAEGLVPPQQKRKALIKRLEKLADQVGEDSISQLEKSVKKLQRSAAEKTENNA